MASDDEPLEFCPICHSTDCLQSQAFAVDKAARIAELRASVAALGNEGTSERERWVVGELLRNIRSPFREADLISVPKEDEPPDVLFDVARFEVKELYDERRWRLDEYRERLLDAQNAMSCAELRPLEPYIPRDTTLGEALELAIVIGNTHRVRYEPRLTSTLDLLLYHNLVGVFGMPDTPFPATDGLCSQGWRSVSVVFGHRTIVFCARTNAPAWLQSKVGTVTHRSAITQ